MSAPDGMNRIVPPSYTVGPKAEVRECSYGVYIDFGTGGGAALEDEEAARSLAAAFTEAADLLAAQKARKARAA